MGRINFLRIFIPNLDELIKTITNMVKIGNEVKWNKDSKESFETLKKSIGEAPLLINLDYTKPFLIFSFASTHTIENVILQNIKYGHE